MCIRDRFYTGPREAGARGSAEQAAVADAGLAAQVQARAQLRQPVLQGADVGVADGAGQRVEMCIRDRGEDIPVILLTARDEAVDRIIGLEAGADDYVGKPFDPRELLARIRCVYETG